MNRLAHAALSRRSSTRLSENNAQRGSAFFQIRKKVHWSDTDAAGVVWFPNVLRWFEDAEEELFASLGRSRQSLLDSHQFGMPRVEVHSKLRAPAHAGQIVLVGIRTTVDNPRRLRHAFEIRDDQSDQFLAEGFATRRFRVMVAERSAGRCAETGVRVAGSGGTPSAWRY